MRIKEKLNMTPAEAAHVLALTVLKNAAIDMNALVERVMQGRGCVADGVELTDAEVGTIYRQYAKLHNRIADRAEKRFGLDTVRL